MDWQVVTKKSKGRIRSHKASTIASELKVSFLSFRDIIGQSLKNAYFLSLAEKVSRDCIGKVIAVGIGNFSSSYYSTSQQALYEYIIAEKQGTGEVYDPGYLPIEIEYLTGKNWIVNCGEFNKEREYDCTFVMIHCHYTLYEKLLEGDVVKSKRVVIIGNSLKNMKEKFESDRAKECVEMFFEEKLETTDLAFSDTFVNKNYLI